MAVLRRTPKRRMSRSAERLRGCPLTRNQSNWCFAICSPVDGKGTCGRAAPHAVLGRTQLAILKHRAAQEREQAID
jgi:hypothetical protein